MNEILIVGSLYGFGWIVAILTNKSEKEIQKVNKEKPINTAWPSRNKKSA